MDFKKLAPVLFALGLSVSAKAQVVGIVPVKLPTTIVSIIPVQMPGKLNLPLSLPTIDGVIITPIRSPYTPAYIPVSEPVSLPIAPALIVGRAALPGAPSLPVVEAFVATTRNASKSLEGSGLFDGRSSRLPSEKFF